MPSKTPKLLDDIRDAAAFIIEVTRGISLDDYGRNRVLSRGIEHNFDALLLSEPCLIGLA